MRKINNRGQSDEVIKWIIYISIMVAVGISVFVIVRQYA
jgi:hypothetical protein